MSRIGVNPLHNTKMAQPPLVSLCVLAHQGDGEYDKEKLWVTDLCLTSMLRGYGNNLMAELIIWNNGSSQEFEDMLRDRAPDVYVNSYNQGCESGIKNMFSIARGKYLAYTDDDIFFYPGWFEQQMEVLTTYPNVASVSGSPMRGNIRHYFNQDTIEWARSNAYLQVGKLMPEQWRIDAYNSITYGRDEGSRKLYDERNNVGDDYLISYKGVRAWAHGHHMQFLCEKDVMAPFRKASYKYMDSPRMREKAMAEAGLMRLTTYERTCRHIGNHIDADIRALAQEYGYL